MNFITVDASVVIKWIFPVQDGEEHVANALDLLQAIKQGIIEIVQPPHWIAEVVAVVTRLQPKIAKKTISLLDAMEFSIMNSCELYQVASQLAHRFDHHLFDTLYHAVALCKNDARLITADEKYYKKAAKQGSIIYLADFSVLDF